VESGLLLAEREAYGKIIGLTTVLLADQPEGVLCFMLLAIVVFGFVAFAVYTQHQRRTQVLERIAQRYRGRLEQGNFLQFSQIRLRFQNYPALVKFTKVGKHSHHTHFTITWPEPGLRCEVYPQDLLSGFRRLWGMEDIEIGSPQFDQAFFIAGNSREQVRELLTAEVQGLIMRLTQVGGINLFGAQSIQVKWAGGAMTVTKPTYLSGYDDLDRFITLSAELFIAAMNTRTTGITFVDEGVKIAEPDEGESQCQVCGEVLAVDLVYCSACKTPSHRECWEYFGGCSTYACGNKKYLVRSRKKAAK
jgi:hypothetical protein